VTGDVTFEADSIYVVEVQAPDQADLLSVTGTVTIHGGEVRVTQLGNEFSYQGGQSYTIIRATGGLVRPGDAEFDLIEEFLFLSAELEYGTDESGTDYVALVLSGDGPDQDFTTVAETFNQFQAASALNDLDQTDDDA